MIGRYLIDTSVFYKDADKYYSMLDPKVNSIVTVYIDNKPVHLKCVLSWGGTCEGCYFKTKGICPKNGHNSIGIACAPQDRFEGNHCIYVEVTTKKKIKEKPAEVKNMEGFGLKKEPDTDADTWNKLKTSQLISNRHFSRLAGYRTSEDTIIKNDFKDDYFLWQTI